jgi:hypothetical protein
MFVDGFFKTAAGPIAQLTPEEYYDLVREKDPYVGGAVGAAAGLAHGAFKGKAGARAAKALKHGGIGAAAGTAGAYGVSKLVKKHQANKVYKMTGGLRLRSSPSRSSFDSNDGGGESGS